MFKKLLLFFFSFFAILNNLSAESQQNMGFQINRNDYTFSRVFELSSNNQLITSVVKSSFRVRTNYDLYDRHGKYQGQGICRIFCLGLFYTWGTEIDIYNDQGIKIGFIDGQVVTSEQAKFSLYNKLGEKLGIAYLDQNCAGFIISDPDNSTHVLAYLKRIFVENTVDYWDVMIYEPNVISDEILQIFAAFACDTQDRFKKDK